MSINSRQKTSSAETNASNRQARSQEVNMATFLRLMFQTDSFCFFVQSYRFRNNNIYIILEKSFISLLMFQTYINKVNGRWSIGSEAWGQREIVHFELLVTTTYIIVYQYFKSIIFLYPYYFLKYIISLRCFMIHYY